MAIDTKISYVYHDPSDTSKYWQGYTEDFDSGLISTADKIAEQYDLRTVGKSKHYFLDESLIITDLTGGGVVNIYTNNGALIADRTVDLNGFFLKFLNSLGLNALTIEKTGEIALNTSIIPTFGLNSRWVGKTFANAFYGVNCSNSSMLAVGQGTTKQAVWGDIQGGGSGTFQAGKFTNVGSSKTTGVGVFGSARNSSFESIGGHFQAGFGSGVLANRVIGVKGEAKSPLDEEKIGGQFKAFATNDATVYTGVDFVGGDFDAYAGNNAGSTVTRAIGGKFNASLGKDANYGVWIESGLFRYDVPVLPISGTVNGQIEIVISGVSYYIEVKR